MPFRCLSTPVRRLLAPVFTAALYVAIAGGALALDDRPLPAPALTPAQSGVPVAVTATLLGVVDGRLAVQETAGAKPVAFPIAADAAIVRGGDPVALDALRPGDELRMTVDGRTGSVLRLDADPRPGPRFAPAGEVALLAALGFVGGAATLVVRQRRPRPLLPASRRPSSAGERGRAALRAAEDALAGVAGGREARRVHLRS